MKKETAVAAIIVFAVLAFVCGYFLGTYTPCEGGQHEATAGHAGTYDSSILPIGDSPSHGSSDAKATIVLFLDFTTSSSRQTAEYVETVTADDRFAGDVRLVVKVIPGRGQRSQQAAATALFAAEHGHFFGPVYDALLDESRTLNAETLQGIIQEAGMDLEDYQAAIEENRYQAAIDADVNLARSLGLGRAPAVVINGRSLTGQRIAVGPIREVVFGEIEAAAELAHTPADQVYAERVRDNAELLVLVASRGGAETPTADREARRAERVAERPARPERNEAAARRQPTRPAAAEADDIERIRVPVGTSPARGADDALVTIIEFSDFHCPFCSRVEPTIDTLIEEYGDDLRVVWKNNPLPMHSGAPEAHMASMAAHDQGKFWEMQARMFSDRARDRAAYEAIAQDLGLQMDRFNAFIDQEMAAGAIEADQELARTAAARGTPHFFINGRRLRGAQPVERWREIIDSELEITRAMVADGVARSAIYDNLMADALAEAPAPAPQQRNEPEPLAAADVPEVGDSAFRGPVDAPVTMFVFSEFQCPYCGRGAGTVDQVLEEYGDRVRVVFKSFPLPFHGNANLASQAALAANAQGQFWEYHDVLFQNQRALERPNLEQFAQDLGLDMTEFRAALDDGRYSAQVDREQAEGRRAGVSGTPTFVINGERVVGAVPLSRLQPVIERHLND